jgi:allantoin racemase
MTIHDASQPRSKTRIWHQGFIEMQSVPAYGPALERHLAAICGPDTEVVIHGLRPGTYTPYSSPAEITRYAYVMHLHVNQILDNVRQAEREGFDAVGIAILQNPGLREARTLVDIPVVGYGEAAMHLACQLGERFSVLAFNPDLFPLVERQIAEAGLERRAGPMGVIEVEYADVARAFEQPDPVMAAFEKAAREAIAGGADVLIPGQTILAEVLWQNGLFRVGEAPVIDALGAVVKTAELLVHLRRSSGLTVSRHGYYWAKPRPGLIDRASDFYRG